MICRVESKGDVICRVESKGAALLFFYFVCLLPSSISLF